MKHKFFTFYMAALMGVSSYAYTTEQIQEKITLNSDEEFEATKTKWVTRLDASKQKVTRENTTTKVLEEEIVSLFNGKDLSTCTQETLQDYFKPHYVICSFRKYDQTGEGTEEFLKEHPEIISIGFCYKNIPIKWLDGYDVHYFKHHSNKTFKVIFEMYPCYVEPGFSFQKVYNLISLRHNIFGRTFSFSNMVECVKQGEDTCTTIKDNKNEIWNIIFFPTKKYSDEQSREWNSLRERNYWNFYVLFSDEKKSLEPFAPYLNLTLDPNKVIGVNGCIDNNKFQMLLGVRVQKNPTDTESATMTLIVSYLQKERFYILPTFQNTLMDSLENENYIDTRISFEK